MPEIPDWRSGMKEVPLNIGRGFIMGSADIVPGVSGGTMALVLGIYRRFVGSIRSGSSALGRMLRLDVRGFLAWLARVEWTLLVPLLIGILIAVFTLAHYLEIGLSEYPEQMAGLFMGLVAGSVVIAWGLLTERDSKRLVIMVLVGIVMYFVLGLSEDTSGAGQDTSAELYAFAIAGALAICAMILPGISGSFILVLLGMYEAVLAAVNDLDWTALLVFVLGATIGLALFSQVLHWALENFYNSVMAALIGLMLGSVRVLWPWPDGVGSTLMEAPAGDAPVLAPLLLMVVGFFLVLGITELSKYLERRTKPDEVSDLHA